MNCQSNIKKIGHYEVIPIDVFFMLFFEWDDFFCKFVKNKTFLSWNYR